MATEKFHYTSKSGKKITLPKFGQGIKAGFIRRIRKLSEGEQVFEFIEAVADEKTLEVIDDFDTAELGEFFGAWQKDAGVGVGESSASAS
ncbi:hypothetical protein [Microbacterium sp. KR10-403]|uniref:hypothetical protein n=1 Tax=Microbacterium sp. KR10-403 TaxID=3158581 RepID=UPI0032E42028